MQGSGARHGQHEDDRLGPVGDRGQCVEGQGREALDRGDPLLPGAPCRPGRPDQQVPEDVAGPAVRVCHHQALYGRRCRARRHADVRTAPLFCRGVHVRSAMAVDRPDPRMIPEPSGGWSEPMELWELVARESCRDTLAQYTHAGDRFLLEEFAAAFCEDGVLEIRGSEPITGRPAIIERFGGRSSRARAPVKPHVSSRPAPRGGSSVTTSPTSGSKLVSPTRPSSRATSPSSPRSVPTTWAATGTGSFPSGSGGSSRIASSRRTGAHPTRPSGGPVASSAMRYDRGGVQKLCGVCFSVLQGS